MLLDTKDKVKIDELWSDFDKQIKVEVIELMSSFDDILDKPTTKKLKSIISNLGDLTNILEERRETNDIAAQKEFYELKCNLIKRFSRFIFNMFSKIICTSMPLSVPARFPEREKVPCHRSVSEEEIYLDIRQNIHEHTWLLLMM